MPAERVEPTATTCKMVAETRTEQVPVRTCRMVSETATRQVPVCVTEQVSQADRPARPFRVERCTGPGDDLDMVAVPMPSCQTCP